MSIAIKLRLHSGCVSKLSPNHRIPGFLKKNDEFQSLLVIPQYRKDQWHHFITITNKKRVVQWFKAMTSRKHPSDFFDPSPGGAQL